MGHQNGDTIVPSSLIKELLFKVSKKRDHKNKEKMDKLSSFLKNLTIVNLQYHITFKCAMYIQS